MSPTGRSSRSEPKALSPSKVRRERERQNGVEQLNITLPIAIKQAVEKVAKREIRSSSAQISLILRDWLKQHEPELRE